MKKLLFIAALLSTFIINAQNSFKLKVGSVLTYQVEENGKAYDLTVTVESLTPFKVTYKNADGTRKGNTSVEKNSKQDFYKYDYFVPGNTGTGALVVLPDYIFKAIYQLEQNYRDGNTEDTTSVPIRFASGKTVPFGKIGFQVEDVDVNDGNIGLHTYAIDEMGVDFADGYIMRINIDSDYPYVTYLNDIKGKFSIHLIAAKGVEAYEYLR